MVNHQVVSHDDWLAARKEHLAKEKEFTRLRDQLARQRQQLPWEIVEQNYVFDGPSGKESLADLFDGRNQLIIYHFMLGPGWEAGCPSCSYLADHFNPAVVHLAQRDVTMIAVSKAKLEEIDAFKKRMGWSFKWVSSFENEFNRDFDVSFSEEELKGDVTYNYGKQKFPSTEAPGLSVFSKDSDGAVYHTYSSFGRGLDMFITAYHFLDTVPKGRDESDLSFSMEWIRLHDMY